MGSNSLSSRTRRSGYITTYAVRFAHASSGGRGGGASRTGFKVTLCNDAVSVQYHFHEFDIEVA